MDIAAIRASAESGNSTAQAILGISYLDGIGVEVDYEEAFRLLTNASEKGIPRALSNLARMYARGLGIPKDLAQAIRLYEKAALAGEFLAQIELGRLYSSCEEVRRNPELAKEWYSAALSQKGQVADCEELSEAEAYIAKLR